MVNKSNIGKIAVIRKKQLGVIADQFGITDGENIKFIYQGVYFNGDTFGHHDDTVDDSEIEILSNNINEYIQIITAKNMDYYDSNQGVL